MASCPPRGCRHRCEGSRVYSELDEPDRPFSPLLLTQPDASRTTDVTPRAETRRSESTERPNAVIWRLGVLRKRGMHTLSRREGRVSLLKKSPDTEVEAQANLLKSYGAFLLHCC